MGSISDWMSTDFDDASMRFKFNPLSGIEADLMGDKAAFPRTFPYNKGVLGVQMNSSGVSAGSIPGTLAYGQSSYTTWTSVAPGDSYKIPNISGTSVTICVWFKPTAPATGARNWIWADMDALNDFSPYRGWWLAYSSVNQLEFNRGDGGGTTSGDRKSFFGATFDGSGTRWQFAAIIISNDSNVLSSSTNWMYAYKWNGSAYVWSNGATNSVSPGSGTAMAWSVDSGTETTNCMIINPSGPSNTGFIHELGHLYVFSGALSQTQVEYVRDMTDLYT
jgi:hypothetical protein